MKADNYEKPQVFELPEKITIEITEHRAERGLKAHTGHVIHDYLSSYYRITGLQHGSCNVHHIRDLTCVHEEHGQQ